MARVRYISTKPFNKGSKLYISSSSSSSSSSSYLCLHLRQPGLHVFRVEWQMRYHWGCAKSPSISFALQTVTPAGRLIDIPLIKGEVESNDLTARMIHFIEDLSRAGITGKDLDNSRKLFTSIIGRGTIKDINAMLSEYLQDVTEPQSLLGSSSMAPLEWEYHLPQNLAALIKHMKYV